jgi:uncharacterized protein YndB with AHSA1/START domain
MSVKQEDNGRRSVTDEFDVHGTPEEVWEAIATGPGMSAWFVPAEFEQRDGKPVTMRLKFGPTMEPAASITAWDPPRMYAGQNEGWGGSPPIATEWHVEARAGGMCRVRIVHSLFASTDDWDDQLEAAKSGWSGFLAILRVYLEHFRGMRSALMQIVAPVSTPDAETWNALVTALGLGGARAGAHWVAPGGAPPLGGVVESLTADPYDALIRIDAPAPGIVALGAATYPGGQGVAAMNLYAYGDDAEATVTRVTPPWQAWFTEHFPPPTDG